MSGVSCWNDANYGGRGAGYTSNANTDTQKDSISSAVINPWTKVVFYAGINLSGDYKTFTTGVYEMRIPNFKSYAYDSNPRRNLDDSVSSIAVQAVAQPACVNAMDAYLTRYPDIRAAGVDPWQHYVDSGRNEGRYWSDPTCDGSPNACVPGKAVYLKNYPDVAAANHDGWTHYATWGRNEGRAWTTIACDGSAVQYTDPNNCPYKIRKDTADAAVAQAKKDADAAVAKKAEDDAAVARQAKIDADNQKAIQDEQDRIKAAAALKPVIPNASTVNNAAPVNSVGPSNNAATNTNTTSTPAQTNQTNSNAVTAAPKSSSKTILIVLAALFAAGIITAAVLYKPKKKVVVAS